MSRKRLRAAGATCLFLLPASCLVPAPVPEPIYSPCHALGSSDWQARVEIFPSSHPMPILHRKLVVTGKVVVPGNGISVGLERGPVSRLDEPIQQILVRTEGSPGSDAEPETRRVRGVFPALKRYGGVAIRCGDGIIAEIRDVPMPPRQKRENPFTL